LIEERIMDLYLDEVASPIGVLYIVTDGTALRAIEFDDYGDRLHRFLRVHCGDYTLHAARRTDSVSERIKAYLDGDFATLDGIEVRTAGTAFQRKVWAALRDIPVGATMSYGQLAARIGAPTASRAVGLANGANPIPIVVPCHRVIGANGRLTGFGGGLHRKQWLLAHESRQGRLTETHLASAQTQLRML
jgi:methylated-DNA-[protein]-cysteine S-methyltransferase